MRTLSLRRLGALALATACIMALAACHGAGDGGVTDTNDYLDRGVTVTPDSTSALSYVGLEETSGDEVSSCIGVEAHRVSNVFSAAFSIAYDPTLLRYTGFDASTSCLGTGAAVLSPLVDATTTPGVIVVGLTRNASTTTTGVNGCGHLIDLCFDVIGEGTFDMGFTGNLALLQPDGTAVADLGANWVGSSVVVNQ